MQQDNKTGKIGRPRKEQADKKEKRVRITLTAENAELVQALADYCQSEEAKRPIREGEHMTRAYAIEQTLRSAAAKHQNLDTLEGAANSLLSGIRYALRLAAVDDMLESLLVTIAAWLNVKDGMQYQAELKKEKPNKERLEMLKYRVDFGEDDKETYGIGTNALISLYKSKKSKEK